MKKKLLFVAVTVLALASCSSDETVAVKQDSNVIGFRPLVNGLTRTATDVTTANLPSFNVTAFPTGTNTSPYINDVTFSKNGTTFTSVDKYYWPSNNLDFYAYFYSSTLASQITKTDYHTFVVTPAQTSETAGDQVDLVYAAEKNKGKNDGATGLPLNFRHTGAKVALKVTHSNANPQLKFEVKAWAVGYLDNSGTFTFPDYSTSSAAATTGNNSTTLDAAYWTNNTGWASDMQIYRSTDLGAAVTVDATTTTNHTFTEEMILVPQGPIPAASAYQSATANAEPSGSFVAVKMAIKNVSDGSTVQGETWAMWPVSVKWEPGKRYLYNVNIDDGGYFEKNPSSTITDLEPILKGSVIYFANVTVDTWNDETPVASSLYDYVKGGNYNFNVASDAAGLYNFTIGGLTVGSTVAVASATDNNLSSITVSPTTVPASGTVTVSGTLAANSSGSAVTSTITLNETVVGTSTTTINIIQAMP